MAQFTTLTSKITPLPVDNVDTDQIVPVKPTGIAKSLNIGDPAAGLYALEAVRRTGSMAESVSHALVRLNALYAAYFSGAASGEAEAPSAPAPTCVAGAAIRPDSRGAHAGTPSPRCRPAAGRTAPPPGPRPGSGCRSGRESREARPR